MSMRADKAECTAMLEDLFGDLCGLVRIIVAVPAALLPRRRWGAFPRLPVRQAAFVSGLLTLAVGVAIGVHFGLAFIRSASDALADAALGMKTNTIPLSPFMSASGLSPLLFLLATPTGWLSDYLVLSGLVRMLGAWFGEPMGDPLLSGLDDVLGRLRGGARDAHLRRSREREEGPEVPDRRFTGEWAGLPGVDFVVVASRAKPDWTKGTFVITSDKWYVLEEPFDLRLPQGLRTAYPLTELKVFEVLRRGVSYELPPLERGRRAGAAVGRGAEAGRGAARPHAKAPHCPSAAPNSVDDQANRDAREPD